MATLQDGLIHMDQAHGMFALRTMDKKAAGPSTGITSGNPSRNASTILPVAMRQGPKMDQQKWDHVQAHLDAWWNSFTDRRLRWVYTKKAGGQIMGSAWQQGNLDTIGLKRQGSSSLIQSPMRRPRSSTFDDTVKKNEASMNSAKNSPPETLVRVNFLRSLHLDITVSDIFSFPSSSSLDRQHSPMACVQWTLNHGVFQISPFGPNLWRK